MCKMAERKITRVLPVNNKQLFTEVEVNIHHFH